MNIKERLRPEIDAILRRYNVTHYIKKCNEDIIYQEIQLEGGEIEEIVDLDSFEENIDWNWIVKNYCISDLFIYVYQNKLDMNYIFDNYMITKKRLEKMNEEENYDKFDILDIR